MTNLRRCAHDPSLLVGGAIAVSLVLGCGGGGSSPNASGAAGAGAALPAAPAGEIFCECDLTEAGAWTFNRQKSCRMSWAKTGMLTDAEKETLDSQCDTRYCQLVTACPRMAPDAVGLCASPDSPDATTRTYLFIEKANITPDATAFGLNPEAICGNTPYDLAGNPVMTKCTGMLKATVDGTPTEFTRNLKCLFKSDGTKSQYFVTGQNAAKNKTIILNIRQEGTTYSVPDNGIAPGFGYLDNDTAFAFPKDADHITVTVTKLAAAGAGLTATFSPGELYTQPLGKGTGPRTFTDGSVDIVVTP